MEYKGWRTLNLKKCYESAWFQCGTETRSGGSMRSRIKGSENQFYSWKKRIFLDLQAFKTKHFFHGDKNPQHCTNQENFSFKL
jgi:hypothetical protein